MTCSRSKPISIILLIVPWRASPVKKLPSAVTGAGASAGAGVGVTAGGDDTTGAGNGAGCAAGGAVPGWGVDVDAVTREG